MKIFILSLLLGLFTSNDGRAQGDFSKVEIKAQRVSGAIHMLTGMGGNIGVSAGADGILMVDDQFQPLNQKIRTALKKIKDAPVKFLINTHWHFDHTGGNTEFGGDSVIVAHENVRKRLSKDQFIDFFQREIKATPKVGLPVVTFKESLSIHFNGEEVKVLHFPKGHTDGDAVIHFVKSNVVHMGDHFFAGMFPFVDVQHGGNVVGYANNVESVLKMVPDDVAIIPGHGPLSTKKDLQTFLGMLRDSIAFVEKGVEEKQSLAQIQKLSLPAKLVPYSKGFIKPDQWVKLVYDSLKERTKPTH